MADLETRDRRSRRRKKNRIAKILFDPNEHRGAFSLKVIDHPSYKREKFKPKDILDEETEEEK